MRDDGESQSRATLGLGIGAVHLMELLEDAGLVLPRYSRPRVRYGDREVAADHFGRDTHLPMVGELDGVADQIEQYLGEALFIAKAKGQGLRDMGAENEHLVLC